MARLSFDWPALEAELQDAVELVIAGERQGPGLAGAASRAVRAVLLRHGLAKARVEVRSEGATVSLQVLFPPSPSPVRQILLRLT